MFKKLLLCFAALAVMVSCSADQKRVAQTVLTDATAACALAVALSAPDSTITQACAAESTLAPFIGKVIEMRQLPPAEKARLMRTLPAPDAGAK